jgi:hypothetical protein
MQTPPTETSPDTQWNRTHSRQAVTRPAARKLSSRKLTNTSISADQKQVLLHFSYPRRADSGHPARDGPGVQVVSGLASFRTVSC